MLALALTTLLAASEAPVVSVMYFENNTKDPELEFMGKGMTDLLITDLVAFDGIRVVERTRLQDVLKELDFQQTKYVDKKTAAKLGQVLNSTYLISGDLLLVNGTTLVVNARLTNNKSGEMLLTVSERDEKDKVFDIEQRLVNKLVAGIDSTLTANAQARRKTRLPDLASLAAYGKALDLSDQGKLDEAQAAMRAVVSKAPSFLLGRERAAELLKGLEEFQKRKKDLVSGAVLELGKVIDQTLKAEPKFDSLSREEKERYLAMRMLKGRYLARVLKQYLSNREEGFRVAKRGEEGKALLAMRAWVENQRRYMAEYARASLQHATVANGVSYPASLSFRPNDADASLIQDAQVGGSSLTDMDFLTLAEFVLSGRLTDGQTFTAAPLLGSVDPKEGQAVLAELDDQIKKALARHAAGDKQAQHLASQLLEFKGGLFVDRGDLDAAVVAYQQLLDAFPTSSRSNWVEGRIKAILEGKGYEFNVLEDWQDALKTCDDMQIRKADRMLRRRMLLSGLKGIDEFAADLEKACLPPTKRTVSAFAQMYGSLAHTAARHDDCERYKSYYRKYLEMNGSVSEMIAWEKHYPWCELGELKKDVTWLRATLDRGWTFDMERHLVSVLSTDDKVLTIMASTERKLAPESQPETFDLRLERQPDGTLACTQARWRRYWGTYIEGTCTVRFTRQATREAPGFDEGTFEAHFNKVELANGMKGNVELTKGEFRVRRQ